MTEDPDVRRGGRFAKFNGFVGHEGCFWPLNKDCIFGLVGIISNIVLDVK